MRDEKTHNYTTWRAQSVICERVVFCHLLWNGNSFFSSSHWEGLATNYRHDDVFYMTPPFPDGGPGWSVIHGKFIAINAASMSCACPRSPKGLSPSAHLADGTTDLIIVRKCSHLDFFRHLLRHTNKDDQVNGKVTFPPNSPYFGLKDKTFPSSPQISRQSPRTACAWVHRGRVQSLQMSEQKVDPPPAPPFADSAQFPNYGSLTFKFLSPCAFPRIINNLHPGPEGRR